MNRSATGKHVGKTKPYNRVFSTEIMKPDLDLMKIKNANVDVVIDDQDNYSVDLRQAMNVVNSSYNNSISSSRNN